jgi:hypothetical protein
MYSKVHEGPKTSKVKGGAPCYFSPSYAKVKNNMGVVASSTL